ncbi:MAG: ribosomal protein S12 methylthiotransferase RimO [Epulopiscium sp. Nele67-Bin004]|nr:MAG: ribosomal protein S12 methylthiotransferase RimO [Epulopiscium sp. Nele67-Bin004]
MTVAFVSLGCDKNLVDSEHMLGLLHEGGFTLTADEHLAQVLVVNTCCFIEDAKQESIDQILEVAEYKETGKCKALIVTGCMAQRYKEEILAEMPEVDAVVGTTSYDQIVKIATQVLEQKGIKVQEFNHIDREHLENMPRILTTAGYFAYIKIAEGCDNRCTYCIIPQLRGKFRSRPEEQIRSEVERLAQDGVSEVILVAQDTTMYGTDLSNDNSLAKLIRTISEVEGIKWIRLLYCYPENITDELIEEIKTNDKVCKYIDMPIQHAADPVLKRMLRRSSNQNLRETIGKLRDAVPDIAIRTTLIVGFPGETEQDFEELCDFVEDMRFDRLGVFTYSQEEGTPAAKLKEQIDEEIKLERKDIIMSLQSQISSEITRNKVGMEMEVLIEGKIQDEDVYIARTYQDAPDVDGQVFVQYEGELISGDYIAVKIVHADEYDLIAEVIEEDF